MTRAVRSRDARSQTMVVSGLGDPRKYLLPDERIVVAVRRHILVLGPGLLETLGFIAAVVMLQFILDYAQWINTVAGLVMLAAVLRFGYLILEWRMERFVITTQRMVLISGVITRRIAAIPLRKVTDLTFDKPIIGQIFGYGTFVIESAGQDQAMSRIEYLPNANHLYIEVSDLLFGSGPDAVYESSMPVSVDPDDDRFHDRQDTDPTLGAKLAGIDFDDESPTGPIDLSSSGRLDFPGVAENPRRERVGRDRKSQSKDRRTGTVRTKERHQTAADAERNLDAVRFALQERKPPRWTRK